MINDCLEAGLGVLSHTTKVQLCYLVHRTFSGIFGINDYYNDALTIRNATDLYKCQVIQKQWPFLSSPC